MSDKRYFLCNHEAVALSCRVDGRVAVIEYKGGDRLSNDDTKRKTRVGTLWQARNAGRGEFLMLGAEDYQSRLRAM